jgi:hypothetical protein
MAQSDVHSYDPDARALQKSQSRDSDARALASGEKSREQLWAENSALLVELDDLVIDFSDCPPGSLR